MAAEDQPHRTDAAFDRIEGTILPCIAMMLKSLVEASEAGQRGLDPDAYADELRRLADQIEALTREVEAMSSARVEDKRSRSAAA